MRPILTSALASALVNALSLGLAAWLFGVSMSVGGFVLAVVLFTALWVGMRYAVRRWRVPYVRAYTVPGGLLLTFVALLLTDWVSSHQGFEIEGWGTWIGVTLVVWAAGIAYGEIDDQAPQRV
ncbi:phage holin family protein [Aeromicrobium sp. IC_218]|uniref:phage holin family protein n=1 Tax=Aeromicrobium sp. IC_218 TaxID=2545468 RepID=UPI00103CFC54|nr:phage holin family protein [Aeromicrobium sp. IC_218]TCI95918.1 hypothetical protein E0W78_15930 [Aeromicrobium sp. IC_218]